MHLADSNGRVGPLCLATNAYRRHASARDLEPAWLYSEFLRHACRILAVKGTLRPESSAAESFLQRSRVRKTDGRADRTADADHGSAPVRTFVNNLPVLPVKPRICGLRSGLPTGGADQPVLTAAPCESPQAHLPANLRGAHEPLFLADRARYAHQPGWPRETRSAQVARATRLALGIGAAQPSVPSLPQAVADGSGEVEPRLAALRAGDFYPVASIPPLLHAPINCRVNKTRWFIRAEFDPGAVAMQPASSGEGALQDAVAYGLGRLHPDEGTYRTGHPHQRPARVVLLRAPVYRGVGRFRRGPVRAGELPTLAAPVRPAIPRESALSYPVPYRPCRLEAEFTAGRARDLHAPVAVSVVTNPPVHGGVRRLGWVGRD